MLSFDKMKTAKILGYFNGNSKSSLSNEKLYLYEPKNLKEPPKIINTDKKQLTESYIKTIQKLTYDEKILLTRAILTNTSPANPKLREYFDKSHQELEEIEKKQLIIPESDKSIFHVVPTPNEHQMITVFGQSGSGKSYWISQFCKEARKIEPKRPIYILSKVEEDAAFDTGFAPKIIRVPLDEDILENPLQPSDFPTGSIIICDDYARISNDKIRKAVKLFVDVLIETCRHNKILAICVYHKCLSGTATAALHSEATMSVLFPRANLNESKKYLKTYCSFNKEQLELVKEISKQSRFIAVTKTYPNIIMSEKEIRIL